MPLLHCPSMMLHIVIRFYSNLDCFFPRVLIPIDSRTLIVFWRRFRVVHQELGWWETFPGRRTKLCLEPHLPPHAFITLLIPMPTDSNHGWQLDRLLWWRVNTPLIRNRCLWHRLSLCGCLVLYAMVSPLNWIEQHPGRALPLSHLVLLFVFISWAASQKKYHTNTLFILNSRLDKLNRAALNYLAI